MTRQDKKGNVSEAIDIIRRGGCVIVIDDESRENEGDFIMAAEFATPEQINFMATIGRGLICVAMQEPDLKRLDLPPMTARNTARHETQFTISVDAVAGTSTGISASDRAVTIRKLADPNSTPVDFARPGHIFPIRARAQGVLERAGHTEAAVDLARLAGLRPCGVLCEIMDTDGSMARLPRLKELSADYGLKLISVRDIIAYRQEHERLVERITTVKLPTLWGDFQLSLYKSFIDNEHHLAIIKGSLLARENVLTRIHSSCLTGDTLGSCRCDCGLQLQTALQLIEREGSGIVVYLRQEGRGIGLANKILAYKLQDEGRDTVEANRELGFEADIRDYATAAQILKDTGIHSVRLLTNNPLKVKGLQDLGVTVSERVPIQVQATDYNTRYLEAKRDKLGHLLRLEK